MRKIMFIVAMATMLVACNGERKGNGEKAQDDGSLKVEINVELASEIDYSSVVSVKAVIDDIIIATTPWGESNLTIILPKEISENLLEDFGVLGGAIISDPEAKTIDISFELFDNQNNSIGRLTPIYKNNDFNAMKSEYGECMYIYSDRQFTITASEFGNGKGIVYDDLNMEKGWNCLYMAYRADIVDFIDEENFDLDNMALIMTTAIPDEATFVWSAYLYGS